MRLKSAGKKVHVAVTGGFAQLELGTFPFCKIAPNDQDLHAEKRQPPGNLFSDAVGSSVIRACFGESLPFVMVVNSLGCSPFANRRLPIRRGVPNNDGMAQPGSRARAPSARGKAGGWTDRAAGEWQLHLQGKTKREAIPRSEWRESRTGAR